MRQPVWISCLPFLVGLLPPSGAAASGEAVIHDPRPAMAVLRESCISCHGMEKAKAGLRLVSREAALKGGDDGPVLVPGSAAESRIAQVILPDSDPHMPPKKQLSEEDMRTLQAWIDSGAAWDETALAAATPSQVPIELRPLPTSYQPVLALALSADQSRLAAGRGGRVLVHDLKQAGRPVVGTLEAHRDAVQSLAWSPDGKRLASGGFRRIIICSADGMEIESETDDLAGRITAMQFTPNGKELVFADGLAGEAGLLRIWDLQEGKIVASWTAHGDSVFGLAISADGALLATAGADKLVKLWDLRGHHEIRRFEGHSGHVLAVAISPDGSLLASGGADEQIKVWETHSGLQKSTIAGHPAAATALAWLADGKTIASACEDGAIRLSNESRNRPDRTFNAAADIIYSVGVTSDGKAIYGGCHDGLVYVWGAGGKLEGTLTAADGQR